MTLAITIEAVKANFATPASDADITSVIAIVDQADVCLSNKGVSDEVGQYLKVLGARHLLETMYSQGQVISERAVSGASRAYSKRPGQDTGHMAALRAADKFGCVMATVTNNARVQFRSVGPLSDVFNK